MKSKKPRTGDRRPRQSESPKELQKITPLLRIDLANWPPAGLDPEAKAKLAARIAEDLRCTLVAAPVREVRGADEACDEIADRAGSSGRNAAMSSTGEGGGGGGDDIDLVECSLIGSGYDIVEIDGVPRYCRIDYYRCADGKTYRRVFPL